MCALVGQLAAQDLVDELAGLGEPGVDDLPQHAAILPRAFHRPSRWSTARCCETLGRLTSSASASSLGVRGLLAQQVHELVARRIGERREHGGVDGVALTVIVHETHYCHVSQFRNMATLEQ